MNPLNPHPLFHQATELVYEACGLHIPPAAWCFLTGAIWLGNMLVVYRFFLWRIESYDTHTTRE